MSMSTYELTNRRGSILDIEASETQNDRLNIGRMLRDETGRRFHDWNIDCDGFWVLCLMLLVWVIFVGLFSYGICQLVHLSWNTS